jgi:ribosome recycling factor
MDAFKKMQKKGELTEDDLTFFEAEFKKLTDKYVAEIDKRFEAKNKDIMSI